MDALNLTNTFISKLPHSTVKGVYFIVKTIWLSNEVKIAIFDCSADHEWEADVSLDDLKESAEELEIPFDKFLEECKIALTTSGGAENYEYLVDEQIFYLIKKDKFEIKYLEIDLIANSTTLFTLEAVDMIGSLRAELLECKKNAEQLNTKYQSMVNAMEKCLEDKHQLEKNLLEKFAVLLNSKKDKIAELQNLLVEKDRILEDAGVSSEGSAQNQSKRKSTDLDEEDDEDFLQPTQVMSQTVERTLPKRVKLAS